MGRWFLLVLGLLSAHSAAGQAGDVVAHTEVVHALPGTDVTLLCTFPKPQSTYIVQAQWSKTDDNRLSRIAVHHPILGTHYFEFLETCSNFSVSFSTRKCCNWDINEASCFPDSDSSSECQQWALHLRNVTISLSGQYECSFATYPFGTKATKIQLIIKAEEEQRYVKEVQLSQALEIPCLENATSANLSNYPLKWVVEENGKKEELITKEPSRPEVYGNGSVLYRQRVHLGVNNALKIFPTKITDDGKVFSCHVVYHPERIRKSSTTVRVFAYPEISASLKEGPAGTSQKPNVSCIVRKAFPKPSIVWYVDRARLTEQSEEMSVEQEDSQDSDGFYQLRSMLMLQGTHQAHTTFSCVCLFPFLRNETWNISSEEMFLSFDDISNEASSQAFTNMASEDLGNSALTSAVMTTSEHQFTSSTSPDFTTRASLAHASTTQGELISAPETKSYTSITAFGENVTTAYLNDSTTESPKSLKNATRSSEDTTPVHSNVSFSITAQPVSATKWKGFFTTIPRVNSTGNVKNTVASRFPWPTVVAVMLLFCSFLIVLVIRKWCQYQKEIMNRPPSFKPPPPPIKYTSMVESDGTPPSYHELENL
ncbi:T-cell surface protein tactile isoform X1 [Oxyura jamaicensis]|uniref:T-cell surface protein tactile isoform X1 n=1 Tax=Oxyura jamaicensis TaxID=8884 RepID=UPI0015A67BDB|nr:T-cell surface protein tactile isoform X1 [Oxyura jamaicensis]XP_035171022.1 T-cell surface protein tactile isoform X1 [Oxyura jamaicensis]XP_035171023.1 T-cell surface protein tactile isoform X1 [Oxyura jamaicensis]